ncbi:MAG: DNA polymerase III subunit delta [Oscillospiraceae bacterium]|nr:DNA polymerase III subunit delta [Oscillospiraceae bacterium]
MRYTDEFSFGKVVRAGTTYPVYLLYGSERYLIEKWAKSLLGKGESSPFNSQRLDGQHPDLGEIWSALEALPLFAQEKVVHLDDFDPSGLSPKDLEDFAAMLADIPPSSRLIVTAKAASFATSAVGKKIIKLVEEHGAAVELSIRGRGDLVKFLQAGAKRLGCDLSGDGARHLVEICPADMQLLENELAKVCAFAGSGEIDREKIDAMVTPKTEASAFELSQLILRGSTKGALELLGRLFYLREEPIAILGALSVSFCDLYRACAAKDAGLAVPAMVKTYGYKSEFRAKKAFQNAGKLSLKAARKAVTMLCECDAAMKSTAGDARIRLEQLTVKLTALCGEGR